MPFEDGLFDFATAFETVYFWPGIEHCFSEVYRILKPGGKLLLSDLFFGEPERLMREAGFLVLHAEDMTAAWREYYLEALWRDDAPCCEIPKGKSSYWLLIARKD